MHNSPESSSARSESNPPSIPSHHRLSACSGNLAHRTHACFFCSPSQIELCLTGPKILARRIYNPLQIRTIGPRRAPISKPSETAQRTRRDETPFSALEAWHPEEGGTTKRGEAGVPSLSLSRATQTRLGGEKKKRGGPRCLAKKDSLGPCGAPPSGNMEAACTAQCRAYYGEERANLRVHVRS